MSSTTLTNRISSHHAAQGLGLGAVRMFQIGIRDGLDAPEGLLVETGRRSFDLGVKVGRRCCRHR